MSKNGTYLKKCIVCDMTRVVYLSSTWIGGTVTSRLVGITFSDTPQYIKKTKLILPGACASRLLFVSLYNILYRKPQQEAERESIETESVNCDN